MIKFIFFENKEELVQQLRDHMNEKEKSEREVCHGRKCKLGLEKQKAGMPSFYLDGKTWGDEKGN